MAKIPIVRPLIDARNIRPAATQTITGDDVIVHNNRPAVHLTINNDDWNDCTITNGTIAGQKLVLLIVAKTIGELVIADAGNAALHGQWALPYVGMSLELEWDGAFWVEQARSTSYEVTAAHGATGMLAVCFGYDGEASASYSTHFGYGGTASEAWATHFGYGGLASGGESIHFGQSGTASGLRSTHFGANGIASGDYSIHFGVFGSALLYGEFVQSSGKFAVTGDAQFSRVIFRSVPAGTTDDTLTKLFLDGIDELLTILDEYTYACKITVVGRQDTGVDNFMGTYHVLIQRTDAAAPALVGAVDIIYENNAGGWGAGGGLPVSILAGATDLEVWVEGLVGHNIRWEARVEMDRVGFAD